MSDQGFSIRVGESEPGTHVVFLTGELDAVTADGVAETLAGIAGSTVIADISSLTFMDSSGVAEFLKAGDAIRDSGNELVIRGASAFVRRVFEALGISDMLADA